MKIACDKCHKVADKNEALKWLTVMTFSGHSYLLCPDCKEGFWMAVDDKLPPIVSKDVFDELNADLIKSQQTIEDLRNEPCLECGAYINSHLGACNGCRWKKDDG